MRTSIRAALVGVILSAGVMLCAQGQDIALGDSRGASFAFDSVGVGTASDYDGLIGDWNIHFQSKISEKDYGPARSGTWTFKKSHDGYMVEDEFSLVSPKTGSRSLTLTYRVFNSKKHVWEIEGVDRGGDSWLPGTTWRDGADLLVVEQEPASPQIIRIRYFQISQNHFLWRADISSNGGKTWSLDSWKIEATRQ